MLDARATVTIPEEPIYGTNEDTKLTFSLDKQTQLQSYQFSLSKSDVNGSFSLTFFPDKIGEQTLFDKIQILDIVEIYENRIENGSSLLSAFNPSRRKNNPVFIGIVKSKKYVAQVTDGGIVRRLQVSGIRRSPPWSYFWGSRRRAARPARSLHGRRRASSRPRRPKPR